MRSNGPPVETSLRSELLNLRTRILEAPVRHSFAAGACSLYNLRSHAVIYYCVHLHDTRLARARPYVVINLSYTSIIVTLHPIKT